jgi:hypothetical protein
VLYITHFCVFCNTPIFKSVKHIINTFHQISNISYSPRIVWHQNKSVIPTKEHSNHYLQNVFISTVSIYRAVASTVIGGGGVYSYIRVLPDGFLLKSIVFTVCKHEYMNIHPPQLSCLATALTIYMLR